MSTNETVKKMKEVTKNHFYKLCYEDAFGKKISERTWYRLKKEMILRFECIDTERLKFVGEMRKKSPNVTIESLSLSHKKVSGIFQKNGNKILGFQLFDICKEITKNKPNRSTIYRWLDLNKLGYEPNFSYTKKECYVIISKAYNYLQRENQKKTF